MGRHGRAHAVGAPNTRARWRAALCRGSTQGQVWTGELRPRACPPPPVIDCCAGQLMCFSRIYVPSPTHPLSI
eukprot:351442-Chlamydomonas_euryale.AAC.6